MQAPDFDPLPAIDRKKLSPASLYCIGKNYREHAREMLQMEGVEQERLLPDDPEPIVFMKPPTALETGGEILMPYFDGRPLSSSMHYEVELVLLIGRDTDGCSLEEALSHVAGIGVGLDMTLRDVQLDDKRAGNPWLKSKGFRKSAHVSDLLAMEPGMLQKEWCISLELNEKEVQRGCISEMIHSPAGLIHYLSSVYGLRKGDLIFTGTPAGVGPVAPGDRLTATLWEPHGKESRREACRLQAHVSHAR